jgi:hypothetical protein
MHVQTLTGGPDNRLRTDGGMLLGRNGRHRVDRRVRLGFLYGMPYRERGRRQRDMANLEFLQGIDDGVDDRRRRSGRGPFSRGFDAERIRWRENRRSAIGKRNALRL